MFCTVQEFQNQLHTHLCKISTILYLHTDSFFFFLNNGTNSVIWVETLNNKLVLYLNLLEQSKLFCEN